MIRRPQFTAATDARDGIFAIDNSSPQPGQTDIL
jgi:hypothetical protein